MTAPVRYVSENDFAFCNVFGKTNGLREIANVRGSKDRKRTILYCIDCFKSGQCCLESSRAPYGKVKYLGFILGHNSLTEV